jgi:mRNA interferase HigB
MVAVYLVMRYNDSVHVISRKALVEFWERYPDSKEPLLRWYKIMANSEYESFDSLRRTFPSADQVKDLVIFNIGGNKYRLIASIHFNRGKVYIRHVLTHRQYDQGAWKQ